ncbi:MAG: hypothetical protein IJI45_09555 [Anaerolineaceae bacterium]|nr:hypothetical protein [Anaerolineaceae bacterium]
MRKYRHELRVNDPKRKTTVFIIDIEKTRHIELRIAKNYIQIVADLSKRLMPKDILADKSRIFPKALKQAMLLYLVMYSEPIKVRSYYLMSGGDMLLREESPESPYIYSLITKKLLCSTGESWKRDAVLQGVAACEDNRLKASLNAYLMSKSKTNVTERFLYLWMAMNGLYGHYAVKYRRCKGNNDTHMQKEFARLYGFSNLPESEIADKLRSNADKVIYRNQEHFSESLRMNNLALLDDFRLFLGSDVGDADPYWYYLIRHSYSYRCRIFHANYQLKLLSKAEESEIVVLRALSDVLEDFLDRNLPKWFDCTFVEREVKPRANGTELRPLSVF